MKIWIENAIGICGLLLFIGMILMQYEILILNVVASGFVGYGMGALAWKR